MFSFQMNNICSLSFRGTFFALSIYHNDPQILFKNIKSYSDKVRLEYKISPVSKILPFHLRKLHIREAICLFENQLENHKF